MVDVSLKQITQRVAIAEAEVIITPKIAKLIKENTLKKGDVLTVAQLAGIVGAKKTSDLIPLCHNISLNSIKVTAKLSVDESPRVFITAAVKCDGKTGVEMEALTAATVAALTVYDMCKAVTHEMTITNVRLTCKMGGKSGDYEKKNVAYVRPYETAPIAGEEIVVGPI